jgi:hypothetical protein
MRTRANKIREYLYLLQDWGFLDKVKVNKYWFSVVPTVPQKMAWLVGPSNVGLNDQVIGPDHDLNNTEVIDV